jgi:hypothetical protein
MCGTRRWLRYSDRIKVMPRGAAPRALLSVVSFFDFACFLSLIFSCYLFLILMLLSLFLSFFISVLFTLHYAFLPFVCYFLRFLLGYVFFSLVRTSFFFTIIFFSYRIFFLDFYAQSQLKVARINLLPLHSCLSVRLSACNNSETVEWIFMKFDIGEFY